jgi:transposase InsO family protein
MNFQRTVNSVLTVCLSPGDNLKMARNAVDDIGGASLPVRFVLHDRDTKFCSSFRDTLRSTAIQPLSLPARSPNLNAFAERWVRSIKSECLSKLILLGEGFLRRAVTQFMAHYHFERPHQGKGNQLLFSSRVSPVSRRPDPIHCHQRLGGLLRFYQRAA